MSMKYANIYMKRFRQIQLLGFALMLLAAFANPAKAQNASDIVRFVDITKGDQGYRNNGQSWATAKSDIQDAINTMHDYLEKNPNVKDAYVFVRGFNPDDDDVIDANGNYTSAKLTPARYYKPTESTETSETGTLFTAFKIYAGIHVYGGFKGDEVPDKSKGETLLDLPKHRVLTKDAIWDFKYQSVLSGNHGTEATMKWDSNINRYNSKFPSNSYHVVWFATNGVEYSTTKANQKDHYRPLDKPASINGFKITGGYAASKETASREHASMGGGVYMVGNSTVSNCEIYNCEATLRGGGIYMDGGGEVLKCHVYQCQALGQGIIDGYGGGVCVEYNGSVRKSYIERNVGRVGGGLAITYQEDNYPAAMKTKDGHPYNPHANTTIVSNNTATAEGGGVFLYGGGTLNQMTITRNKNVGQDVTYSGRRYGRSGGLYIDEIGILYNSVVWGNECAANNNIQYAAQNTNTSRKINGKTVSPRVHYVALQGNDVTNWMGTTHDNVYTLNKNNNPNTIKLDSVSTIRYPYFTHPTEAAGVTSEANPFFNWKPLAYTQIDLLGVQEQFSTDANIATYLINASTVDDIAERTYEPLSTLGAFTKDYEDFRGIMFPSQYEKDGKSIPTVFVDASRVIGQTEEDRKKTGTSWDFAVGSISKCISYFISHRTTSENKSTSRYKFTSAADGFDYEGQEVQILVKQGSYNNAGSSSYLTDENGLALLSTSSLRPCTGLRLIGGYSSALKGTAVDDRNPKSYPSRITANVINSTYDQNASHVVALVNTSHTLIDGFILADGDANQNIRDAAFFESQGGGVLVNNKMQWAQDQRDDMTDNVMRNCVVTNCEGIRRGGAIYVNGYYKKKDGSISRVEFEMENCIVNNNTTYRERLADGKWDDGKGNSGIRQRFELGGVIHANGNAKLTINHSTIVGNVGYGLATSGYVEGQDEENEGFKKSCEIYVNNSMIVSNCNVPRDSRSVINAPDMGEPWADGHTEQRRTEDGKLMNYNTTIICPDANIRGVNNYVDKGFVPDESCKLTQTYAVLGYNPSEDLTYCSFANPTVNIGAVENTNDVTLYGGDPDWTPGDMHPVVNKAMEVPINADGSYKLDPATQYFVDATQPEVSEKTDLSTVATRNIGGQGDVGAIENLTAKNFGPVIHVRMPDTADHSGDKKMYGDASVYNAVPSAGGKDTNDGLSWTAPVATIKKALVLAKEYTTKHPGDTAQVWVAAGTYKENITLDATHSGINVYGGFKAYGNPSKKTNERDISNLLPEYQTIIDGDMKGRVLYQSVDFGKKTIWEGFTIQNGVNFDGIKGTDNEPKEDGNETITEIKTSEWSKGTYGKRIIYTITRTGGKAYSNTYYMTATGGSRSSVGCGAVVRDNMVLKNCLIRKNKLYPSDDGIFDITRYSSATINRVQESKESENSDVTKTNLPTITDNSKYYIYNVRNYKVGVNTTNGRFSACGIWMLSGSVVENCIIRNNESFMKQCSGNQESWSLGVGGVSEGATVINSLIVENIGHNGSNQTGVALLVLATSKLYHCTLAYNQGIIDWNGLTRDEGRPAVLPGVWDDFAPSTLGDEDFKNKATKFYNCVLWGNVGNGRTGENYNPVGRGTWQDGVGKEGFFYNCFHSAPSEKFALEGVNKERTNVMDNSVVFVTHTFDASEGVPAYNKTTKKFDGNESLYFTETTDKYYHQCIAQNLFNEAAEDENGILKYPIVNGMSDNPYSINGSSTLAGYNINMGDDQWSNEMLQKYDIDQDIAGADRIQDCVVDKGAYEYNGSGDIKPDEAKDESNKVTATYYVTWNGRGNTSAGSPATAACHQKLQKVLDAAGRYKYDHPTAQVIVKVAGAFTAKKDSTYGYYATRTADYDQTLEVNPRKYNIQIPRGVEVWGGYSDVLKDKDGNAVNGFDEAHRNILNQKTKFTGYFPVNGTRSQSYHTVSFTDYVFDENGDRIPLTYENGKYTYKTLSSLSSMSVDPLAGNTNKQTRSILDGIFIEDGAADGASADDQRGGAFILPEYAHVRNCVIQNNNAKSLGGGIYAKPWALITGCIIQRNTADKGAGVYVEERTDASGKPVYSSQMSPLWTWMLSNTIVNNTASTSGGGIFFGTNVRNYSSVFWHNSGNDMPNVSGATDTGADENINGYPFSYCAVQDTRLPGLNNVELSPTDSKGTRWVADDSIFVEDKVKDLIDHNNTYTLYNIMKSSVLVRAGLPYSYFNYIRGIFSTIEFRDINGVARMEEAHGKDEHPMTMNKAKELVNKKNDFIEIGARALNDNFEIDPDMIMTRLFVAHTNVMNTDAAAAFQSLQPKDDDSEETKQRIKFYQQVGSSYANPFTRFDDALEYIINARKKYPDELVNSPQSFVKGKQRVRDVRFEIYLTAGTYYPHFNQFGLQGNSRSNTFLIPEKVTVIGGTQVGLDDDGDKATQFYCQDKTAAANESDPVTHTPILTAVNYTIYGENTNVIRNNRPLYDLNHNSIVEPWEMKHQSILSGKSSSGMAKNVYHVVTISGDPNLVGAQPTRFKDRANTDATGNLLLDWDKSTGYGVNQEFVLGDDESYDKMEALNEDTYAGKESVKSLNTHDVFLDGLTITNGYAVEYSADNNPNRNDFYRGGGILVNGNKYVNSPDSTFAGWDSETDAMAQGDRLIHLNVANCEFIGNTAYQGGAIFSNGNVVVTSSSFQQNQSIGVSSDGDDKNYVAYSGGGAIAVSGRFNAANTLFANNEASRGDYDINTSFSETVSVDGKNMTYTRPANSGNYSDSKLVKHAMADVIHGFGGALWGNDLSKIVTVNCNFVRNKAFAFPAVFVSHNNAEWKGYFTAFKDIKYVRHYAANTLFWGNDISATKALDTDKLEDYYYGFNSWYTNRPGTEIQAMYFCAYPEGRGPELSENANHSREYYQNLGYTEKIGLWESMGEANHNVILNLNNDALDGPNFIQPSTVAGVAGYTPSANWLTYRINSLVDNGWTTLKLDDTGNFVNKKDQYGNASTTDAYPDAPDDAEAGGAAQGDLFKEGDYMWRARLFRSLSGLDMLPIGDQKYMYFAKADGNENTDRKMLRVSKDAISRTGKAYIDIGVYEYQHAQLNIADGDDVDVIWVAEREDPFNGNDGRTFDTPTSDLQRAIEMLLLTRCDHKKEVRIKEGTYSPIYQLDDYVYGFNIHVGANENNIALRKTVNAGQPYGIQSLTIKGGYSNFAEDDYNPATHPVTLQMTDHGGAAAGRMAHLFYIYDAEQWTTTPSSAGSTDGAEITSKEVTKASKPMSYALPITFEGLTFVNPYSMDNSTTPGGSAIYYKDQYIAEKVIGGDKNEYSKTTTPLGEALTVGYSYTGETTDENGAREVTGEQLITPQTAAKLTVKNCVFMQNGAEGETKVPAIQVGKGGGEAIIVNCLFHSNSGAPVVGTDTKVVNCTMALNGGHSQLTNSGISYTSEYGKVQNYNNIIVNSSGTSGYTTLGPNSYVSELHNSLIWKDDAAATTQYATQFEVQDGANTLTQNSTFTEDGVVTYNGVLGIQKDGKLVIDTDEPAGHNVGLSDNNTDAGSGPNFQDPENANAAKRNFHVNPSIAVMSKADNKTYVVKAMRMYDPTATEVEETLAEKIVNGKDASERELSNLLRLYGPGMERGAYECTAYLQRVYYVNPQRGEGAGERNGVRWATAYGIGQLQTAIDAAGVYSALNKNAYAYVFVKANTNDNTVGENIIMRDGVMLFGSLPVSFYDEAVATTDHDGNITEYTDDNIDEYEYKVLASRDGIATKGAAHTNIRGIEAYDSEYYTGCFVDGFVVKPAPGDEAHEIPPVAINDNNKVYIRNCVITGFRMTGNYPVVAIRGGILYNSLVYGNTIDPYQREWTQVLFAGSNGYVVNCTVVAENEGEKAVGARADVNQDNGLYKHVINTVTYNNADNSLARVTVSAENGNVLDPDYNKAYINCNEKTGMFAPYFHTSTYAPARQTNYEPYWYQLHENSECIDAGMNDKNVYDEGKNMEDYVANGRNVPLWYNIELHQDRDILGNPRWIGDGVDIGCFETWKIKENTNVLFSKDTNTDSIVGVLTKDGYLIDQNDDFILDPLGNKIAYKEGDAKPEKAVEGIVKYNYTDNFGGHFYPHPGSVTYVGRNANIILDEGDFTYGEAFRPGYLLLKKGASFYGNKGIVGIEYLAVEKDQSQGFSLMAFPYDHKWGDIETVSYDAATDKHTEINQASHVEGAWTYNGAKRSAWNYSFATDNSPCWENLDAGTQMDATEGWLMKLDEKIEDLRFTGYSETDELIYSEEGYDKTFTLTQYNATETVSLTDENSTRNYPHFTSEQNMGWNIKGNPYLVYTYKTYESETTAGGMERYALHIPHVVYGILPNGSFGSYKSWEHRDADVPTLGVGFFAQTAVLGGTGATEVVTVKQPIWETTPSPTPAKGYYAVSIGSNEQASDEVIFDAVAESSAARSLNYSYGRDALKLTAFDENVPQLWMQNDEGTPISLASAAPRETPITLGMRIPSSGDYTFKAMAPSEQEDSTSLEAIWLIDREENIVFDLMQGSYTVKVAAAEDSDEPTINTNRFALQLGGARPGTKQIAKKAHGFYVKQHTLHITNTKAGEKIAIYAASGVLLRRAEATAGEYSTQLLPGVYIVKINDESFKVLVK